MPTDFQKMLKGLSEDIEQSKKLNESREPCVGIFWVIGNNIPIDFTLTSLSIRQGSFDVHDRNHFTIWNILKSDNESYRNLPYDYYPRGRVVCDTEDYFYHVFLDKCIPSSLYQRIKNEFNIYKQNVIFHCEDGHYKCKDCK